MYFQPKLQMLTLGLSLNFILSLQPIPVYDFVVVGSGIGGSNVAIELSRSNHSVLLIEMGPKYRSPNVSVPIYFNRAGMDPNINLNYKVNYYSKNQPEDLEEYRYSRVGGLGGCSLHNVMVSMLPNLEDFQLMAQLTNDSSWNEKEMRQSYFKPMEQNANPNLVHRNEHGFDGWFPIAYRNFSLDFQLDSKLQQISENFMPKKFVDVNGYHRNGKLNVDLEGQVIMPAAIDNLKFNRFDIVSRIEYYQNKYKLDVWTDTLVTKVLLDKNNRAVGINYSKGKYLYNPSPKFNKHNLNNVINGTIKVNKEVILSGGAFNSPQLLMLSGIGPKEQLSKFGIPVKVDLPGVGKNLADKHSISLLSTFPSDYNILSKCTFGYDFTDPCYLQYIQQGKGPYTHSLATTGQLKKSTPQLANPDQFLATVLSSNRLLNIPGIESDGLLISNLFKAKPKSLGELTLASRSPYQQLEIQFNKFNDTNPLTDLQIFKNMVRTRALELQKISNLTLLLPKNFLTQDQALEQFIRNGMTGYHICCTNKVGLDQDQLAVLNSKFQVRNTRGLRVVDASVFPKAPGYFPALFTHLMSLKVAKYILADYS